MAFISCSGDLLIFDFAVLYDDGLCRRLHLAGLGVCYEWFNNSRSAFLIVSDLGFKMGGGRSFDAKETLQSRISSCEVLYESGSCMLRHDLQSEMRQHPSEARPPFACGSSQLDTAMRAGVRVTQLNPRPSNVRNRPSTIVGFLNSGIYLQLL